MTGFREGPYTDAKDHLSHLTNYVEQTLQIVTTPQNQTMTNPLGLGPSERELVRRKMLLKSDGGAPVDQMTKIRINSS